MWDNIYYIIIIIRRRGDVCVQHPCPAWARSFLTHTFFLNYSWQSLITSSHFHYIIPLSFPHITHKHRQADSYWELVETLHSHQPSASHYWGEIIWSSGAEQSHGFPEDQLSRLLLAVPAHLTPVLSSHWLARLYLLSVSRLSCRWPPVLDSRAAGLQHAIVLNFSEFSQSIQWMSYFLSSLSWLDLVTGN